MAAISQTEVIVLAMPGDKVVEAFGKLKGIEGKLVIDATNVMNTKLPAGFASNAEFVKSKTHGPTAKSFNINFAALYGQLSGVRVRPSNSWCGDEEARATVEQLSADAGFEAVSMGPLGNAALQEGMIGAVFAIAQSTGPFFYRIAKPETF